MMRTFVLLLLSNLFMTVAWYGHLRFKGMPLWQAILASWGIAFFEYCLQVPANRWGYGQYSAYQLKIAQEIISISVFVGFAVVWLGERPRWNHLVSFFLILGAVGFAFLPADKPEAAPPADTP
jgi:uncharacterized protein (DUF486 family)